MTTAGPRVAFIGPTLGGHPGRVPSPSEVLAPVLTSAGHDVLLFSDRLGRVSRLVDTALTLHRDRHRLDVAVVLVYSGNAFLASLAAAEQAHRCSIPVILHLHGGNLPTYVERHPRLAARLARTGVLAVAPSRYLASTLPGVRTEIIPNLLDLNLYEATVRSPANPSILWMRTFAAEYRAELAVDALAELRREVPEAMLTMAGEDRGTLEAVRARVEQLGLIDSVRFPGFLDAAGKRKELARHDLFLNTTAVDNAPVSVLEAMASGLIVVAAGVGGIADLLDDGSAGCVVEDPSARRLAAAMATVLGDPRRARRLSEAGRAKAEQSGPGDSLERWMAVISEALTGVRS